MPKAIEVINNFSRLSAKHVGLESELAPYDLDWRDDIKGKTLAEGDRIDLGGAVLEMIYTPGHTNCSISAYEPNLKAMFASDAGAFHTRRRLFRR